VQCLTVQATPYCNLDCKYCYLPNRSQKGNFNLTLIPTIFENLQQSDLLGDELLWDWHAGEPLVAGLYFYQEAQLLIKQHQPKHLKVSVGMQTNASLITDEIAIFFKENNYRIGVSIDGPEELHNYNRVYRNGKGSFNEVMKGIEILQKHEVPFHVICVLSKNSLQYPREIYKFFYHLGITGLAFNIEEVEGIHKNSSLQGNEGLFNFFFEHLYEAHLRNNEPFPIREWQKFSQTNTDNAVNGTTVPFAHLTIDINGNFSTFSPELITMENVGEYPHFIFGNISNGLITDALQSTYLQNIYKEIHEGVAKCSKCDYYNTCGGGMVSNKLFENGTFNSSETMSCRLMEQEMCRIVQKML
jgi:uncharacterized protein